MKWTRWGLLLYTLLSLSACLSYKPYSMEVLRPAYINPSSTDGRILLINNTAVQPPDVGHYFAGLNKSGRDTGFVVPCKMDSLGDLLLNFMTARIRAEGIYKDVDVASAAVVGHTKQGGAGYMDFRTLDKKQRSRLQKASNASIWVSLDGLFVESKATTKGRSALFTTTRDVMIRSIWRVYDQPADSMIKAFQHLDTLYWAINGNEPGPPFEAMPTIDSTLPEIADYVAGEVYRIITPYWERVERYYYVTGNVQLKLASDDVKSDRWDDAAVLWLDAFKKGKMQNRYRAAINLSLYHEKNGDTSEALSWVQRAKELVMQSGTYSFESDMYYLRALERSLRVRIEEMERQDADHDGIVE